MGRDGKLVLPTRMKLVSENRNWFPKTEVWKEERGVWVVSKPASAVYNYFDTFISGSCLESFPRANHFFLVIKVDHSRERGR